MTRKFRAWDKKKGEWLFSEDVRVDGDGVIYYETFIEEREDPNNCNRSDSVYKWVKRDDIAIVKYAGLKDKNGKGKDVYDQDIIKTAFVWLVYFGVNQDYPEVWGWCVKSLQTGKTYFLDESVLRGEVVGNAFETPELFGEPKP